MSATSYTRSQRILHWVVFILVVMQLSFANGMAEAFEAGMESGTLTPTARSLAHTFFGLVILALVIWRLVLRVRVGHPAPPEGEPDWAQTLATATHRLFYAVLIALPVTGLFAWGAASEGAGEIHELLKNILIVMILLHIGAVVMHQFVWRTGLLSRMTGD